MRILDRVEKQNQKANAAIDKAIAFIDLKMKEEPHSCALVEAGLGCACTGFCHTEWYHQAQQMIWDLEAAKLPRTYDKSDS